MRINNYRKFLLIATFLFAGLVIQPSAEAAVGDFLFRFGEPGYFCSPAAMDVDSQGNIYYLDNYKNRVVLFDVNGEFITTFGTFGTGEGQFWRPRDILVTETGEIYVLDIKPFQPRRIQVFNLNGEFLRQWTVPSIYNIFTNDENSGYFYFVGNDGVAKTDNYGNILATWGSKGLGDGELWYPRDIAIGPNGDVYIIDGYPRLSIFSADGDFIEKFRPSRMYQPKGLTVDPEGRVYFTDSQIGKAVLLRIDGTYQLEWGWKAYDYCESCFWSPSDIRLDGQGNIYVLDIGHRSVKLFNSSREFIKQIGNLEDQFVFVSDMIVGPGGNLYVLEGSRIKIFTPAGEHIKTLRSYSMSSKAIAVDADGFVYVLEGPYINKYDSDGNYRTRWGGYSSSKQDGLFTLPQDLAVDSSGHVLVLDAWRHDIQVFDSWGGFLGKIGSRGSDDSQFLYPDRFGLDSQGNFYVRDGENYRIQVLDSSGTFIREWGSFGFDDGQIGYTGSIAIDGDGNVYDSESYGSIQEYNRVQVFDEYGGLLTRWGNEGTGDDAWYNKCVAADPCGRRVYVFDEQNNVIKVFEGVVCEEIIDTTPPEVFPPPDMTVEAEGGATAVDIGMATATDDIGVVSLTNNAPDYFPIGTSTITWIATDAAGNQGFGYQNVTIVDDTPPVIVQPPNIIIEATSSEGQVVNYDMPLVTDLVDPNPLVVCNPPPGSIFQLGTHPITCTAYDNSWNMSRVFFTISIVDTTSPVLVVPPDLVVEATGPETEVALGEATATDIFEPVVVSNDAPAAFPLGDTFVRWRAIDPNGLTDFAVQLITVLDMTPPLLTVPPDVTLEAIGVLSMYTSSDLGIAAADDLVEGAVEVSDDIPAAGFPLGETAVTYTARDSHGNTATATQLITIVDTTPPNLTAPPDITVEATGPEMILDIGTATASDIFEPVELSNDAPASFPAGETTVTWMATDPNGNTATAEQLITVLDRTPPVLTVPADVTLEAIGVLSLYTSSDFGSATADDLVEGAVEVSDDIPAAGFPLGETVVTYTASDSHGNTATATQMVTIIDTTPPELIVPPDITVEATGPETAVDIGTATATDIFEPVEVSNDAPLAFLVGETTVVWMATDANGNSTPAEQVVTVLDTTPPDLVTPSDITGEANGNPNSSVELGTASAIDLVDGEVVATNNAPVDGFPLGTTVVTWTAIDSVDNTATATQHVTVVDTTPPNLTAPADISVIASGPQTVVNIGTATAEDLFGPVNISNDAPGAFPAGETVVTWTATDTNGNTTSATQRVVVRYLFGGFLPPLSQGGIYKQGRTIPVKIRVLYEDGSLVTGLAPTLTLQLLISGELSGEPLDVQSNSAADSGNTFRLSDDHYIYNLDTRPVSSGMYRLIVDLHDGSGPMHFIDVVLK